MENLYFENLYEDEVVRLQLEKAYSVLRLTFLQHPEPEQFRNAYRLAIDTAVVKEIEFWLTDARKIKSMLPENQAWLVQHMSPLFKSKRLQKFAIVMAPECFVMTNPNKVYEKPIAQKEAAPASPIKVHFDLEAGFAWLLSHVEAV
ncbi:hypothetical protein [Rufibacter roseus]|uniref:Uncharacterized protein n=1 Tax=Rufibacter roseus TaxID=1567108 RepID=A0ABW2DLW5_9BACT|nr:hypothetical protein [Rufibacter roseus]